MGAGLAQIQQQDFSAGMFRSVARHLIPPSGAYDLVNLLLDDDGSLYRRGGSQFLAAPSFDASILRWIADMRLTAGERTIVASSSDFGVLDATDSAIVNLGGAGLPLPTGSAVLGGALFIAGGVMYGGSRMAADYSTGTVAVTNGSTTVTGTGTRWATSADAGMIFTRTGGEAYVVRSVDSDTTLTLDRPFLGATASGQAYTLTRLGTPTVRAPVYAAGGDRLITCNGSEIRPSKGRDPATGGLQYNTFDPTDVMTLPDGVEILGAAMVRDLLLVFATEGVWAVTNIAMELTDDYGNVQRRLDKVSGDVVLWGQSGIASWGNGLVVPTVDGVALMDGISPPTPIGRPITPMIAEYVRLGYQPGGAFVYRNHYFLPVLDASANVIDLLVCRLDRGVNTRIGVVFPWTRLAGHGGTVTALARRAGGAGSARSPRLLAAGDAGRVVELTRLFTPDADVKLDADGTIHLPVLDTLDYETGGGAGNRNTVRRLRVRYELRDADTDNPEMTGYYSVGEEQPGTPHWGEVTWGRFSWTSPEAAEFVLLSSRAPESVGRDPFTWLFAAHTRYIRARLTCTDPAARFVIRSLTWGILQSAKDA